MEKYPASTPLVPHQYLNIMWSYTCATLKSSGAPLGLRRLHEQLVANTPPSGHVPSLLMSAVHLVHAWPAASSASAPEGRTRTYMRACMPRHVL